MALIISVLSISAALKFTIRRFHESLAVHAPMAAIAGAVHVSVGDAGAGAPKPNAIATTSKLPKFGRSGSLCGPVIRGGGEMQAGHGLWACAVTPALFELTLLHVLILYALRYNHEGKKKYDHSFRIRSTKDVH